MYPSHLIFGFLFLFFGKHISHKTCHFNHFSMWSSEAPVCLRRVATALTPSRHRARGGPCSAVQLRHSACVGPCASAESHAACPAVPGWSLGFAVPGFVRAERASALPSSFGPAGFHRAHTSHSVYRSPVMDSWSRPPFGCRGRRCSEHVRTRVRLSPGLRLFGGHTHVRADLLLCVAPLHLPFRGPADRSPPPPAGVCAPGRPGSASFRSVALRWVSGGVSLGFTLRFPDD